MKREFKRCCACAMAMICLAFATAPAQVFFPEHCFEGDYFPEDLDWDRLPDGPLQGERRLEDGWFTQTVGDDGQGTSGDYQFYQMELDQFVGVEGFFVEWRAITDNPGWLIDPLQVVTVVSAGGKSGVLYHTVMTDSAVALTRFYFPTVVAQISPAVPHTYRVEVFSNQYIWFIDGVIVENGIPEGPYPDATSRLTWGAGREYVDATTAWDYVRAGEIPPDGFGDFDVNGYQDMIDYYFVHDCLTKDGLGIVSGPSANAGPGCRFTDFDGDTDVDLRDFADFQILFSEVTCEPFCKEPCFICFPRNP